MSKEAMKLVPYDPSIDMQEHGSIASGYDLSQTRAKKVYQAMIDMHDVMMEQEPTDEWLRLQAGYPEQPAQQCKWPTCQSEEYQQVLAEQIKRELVGERPAQQEPVAWTLTAELEKRETTTRARLWFSDPVNCMWTPLYTTPQPAQRTWVGLTDEDFQAICKNFRISHGGWIDMLALEIEAKLKEKNT